MKRIKRDFRSMKSPAAFLAFCLRVKRAMMARSNPTSLADILNLFYEAVDRYDSAYHGALDGGHTLIRERDKIIKETTLILDQLASALESIYAADPDALLATGYSVTQERRSHPRVKLQLESPLDFTVTNSAEGGKAIASASGFPGAFNHEIYINQKDPSVEADWFHKSIFKDPSYMLMENLMPGNTHFRMRHHGPDGPGPWSPIVTTPIT